MSPFILGARFMSLTEPELGLGVVRELQDKQVSVMFGAADTLRVYGVKTAPLKRIRFECGDTVKTRDNFEFEILVREEKEGLFYYSTTDSKFCEDELSDFLSFNKPEEKLFNGTSDHANLFSLRQKTLTHLKEWQMSKVKGLLVLLADEVGLGKTIEAGLIIHKSLVTGKKQRILVIVPEALTYQWFFEMHRKFALGFVAINKETPPEEGVNPFLYHERVIVSSDLLRGSQMAKDMLEEADFDMLVVDEAHQYRPGDSSYEILEDLTGRIPSVLLLTATPEQLGMRGHFDRLRLIDPDRFFDIEKFKEEVSSYKEIAALAYNILNQEISQEDVELCKKLGLGDLENTDRALSGLIDHHGTGRVFLRNTRARMGKDFDFFPKRRLHKHVIEAGGEHFTQKAEFLKNLLSEKKEKILLIVHDKVTVLKLERWLEANIPSIKIGVFHSGQTLTARDRMAAYFADPDGAHILLCTEIGSEGRNFEFASHLVLFDLPKKPDLLEQRIGRLDRIGQKGDVNIHVPYVTGEEEEVLFNLYHKCFNSFQYFSPTGTPAYIKFHKEIQDALEAKEMDHRLQEKIQNYCKELEVELEKGRDLLIEMNSFNLKESSALVKKVREFDNSYLLREYMELVFDCFGVDHEETQPDTFFIKPGHNMFIPSFPGLTSEGLSITYDRSIACEREEHTFLTWDHVIVRETMQLIMSENFGNMTVAMRREAKGKKSFVEAFYILDCPGPNDLELGRYFPTTSLRILVDKEGADFSEKFSYELLDEKLVMADPTVQKRAQTLPKEMLKELMKKAEVYAFEKASVLNKDFFRKAEGELKEARVRIEHLSKVNKNVDEGDLLYQDALNHAILEHGKKMRITLDSLRVIL